MIPSFDERLALLLCWARERHQSSGVPADDWTDIQVLESLAQIDPYVFLADEVDYAVGQGAQGMHLCEVCGRLIAFRDNGGVITIFDERPEYVRDGKWVLTVAVDRPSFVPICCFWPLRSGGGRFRIFRMRAQACKWDPDTQVITLSCWGVTMGTWGELRCFGNRIISC